MHSPPEDLCCPSLKKLGGGDRSARRHMAEPCSGQRQGLLESSSAPDLAVLGEPEPDGVVKIWCGTWNMHATRPPASGFAPWMPFGEHDIYAIATQEAERPIATAVLLPGKPVWESALKSYFRLHSRWRCSEEEAADSPQPIRPTRSDENDESSSGSSTPSEPEYALLCTAAMGGCHLAIVVRRRLLPHVSQIRRGGVPTGGPCGGVTNKGGLAVSLYLGRTSLLFVCAHLAAHAGRLEARDTQFADIDRRLPAALGLPAAAPASEAFDVVLWMGDLNYRVDIDPAEASLLLASHDRLAPQPRGCDTWHMRKRRDTGGPRSRPSHVASGGHWVPIHAHAHNTIIRPSLAPSMPKSRSCWSRHTGGRCSRLTSSRATAARRAGEASPRRRSPLHRRTS